MIPIRLLWIPHQNPSKSFKGLFDSTIGRHRNKFRKAICVHICVNFPKSMTQYKQYNLYCVAVHKCWPYILCAVSQRWLQLRKSFLRKLCTAIWQQMGRIIYCHGSRIIDNGDLAEGGKIRVTKVHVINDYQQQKRWYCFQNIFKYIYHTLPFQRCGVNTWHADRYEKWNYYKKFGQQKIGFS